MHPLPKPIFANSAADPAEKVLLAPFANAMETEGGDGWVKLAEVGNWSHVGGMQRVTANALSEVAANFKSLAARLKRRFKGVPIYVGHPDDPMFQGRPGHGDTRAHGWVDDIKFENQALLIKPRWAKTGEEIMANAHYRFFSPRWRMRPLGGGDFSPVELVSIGLTNNPNIPGEAIANERHDTMKLPQWMKTLLAKLGFSNEQIAALEGENAAGAPTENDILGKLNPLLTASNELATARSDKTTAEGQLAAARTAETNAKAEAKRHLDAFSNERKERVKLLIAAGIREGKVSPTEETVWSNEFTQNFEAAADKLAKAAVKLPVSGRKHATSDKSAAASAGRERVDQIVALANEAMPKVGNNWDRAWAQARKERPELFEEAKAE